LILRLQNNTGFQPAPDIALPTTMKLAKDCTCLPVPLIRPEGDFIMKAVRRIAIASFFVLVLFALHYPVAIPGYRQVGYEGQTARERERGDGDAADGFIMKSPSGLINERENMVQSLASFHRGGTRDIGRLVGSPCYFANAESKVDSAAHFWEAGCIAKSCRSDRSDAFGCGVKVRSKNISRR